MRMERRGNDSLSPVLGGEGWGEGRTVEMILCSESPSSETHCAGTLARVDPVYVPPLSPGLSPEYGGEGVAHLPASSLKFFTANSSASNFTTAINSPRLCFGP